MARIRRSQHSRLQPPFPDTCRHGVRPGLVREHTNLNIEPGVFPSGRGGIFPGCRPTRSSRRTDHSQSHPCRARVHHPDLLCSGLRQVNDPASNEWPPIIYANLDFPAVGQIRDSYPGAERQPLVGRRQLVHVVSLAVAGLATMIRVSVPARDPGFRPADSALDRWW